MDKALLEALESITAADPRDMDAQVEREITRYWNDRVSKTTQSERQLRQIRAMVQRHLKAAKRNQ